MRSYPTRRLARQLTLHSTARHGTRSIRPYVRARCFTFVPAIVILYFSHFSSVANAAGAFYARLRSCTSHALHARVCRRCYHISPLQHLTLLSLELLTFIAVRMMPSGDRTHLLNTSPTAILPTSFLPPEVREFGACCFDVRSLLLCLSYPPKSAVLPQERRLPQPRTQAAATARPRGGASARDHITPCPSDGHLVRRPRQQNPEHTCTGSLSPDAVSATQQGPHPGSGQEPCDCALSHSNVRTCLCLTLLQPFRCDDPLSSSLPHR